MHRQLSGSRTSQSSGSPSDLGIDVASAIVRLHRRLKAERIDDQIGDTHYSVLVFLVKQGPHSLKELSIRERVTPPSMNQTVNALEAAGYVERHDDPDDRRKVLIAATDTGIAMAKKTRRLRHGWLNSRLKDLSPIDREALERAAHILRQIADS
ncbi:MAG: MarR family transcriptional regulator [Actinomycetota bacterium]|nr:MarR family transcriptional regulator [Actinomycetota bacterium]